MSAPCLDLVVGVSLFYKEETSWGNERDLTLQ